MTKSSARLLCGLALASLWGCTASSGGAGGSSGEGEGGPALAPEEVRRASGGGFKGAGLTGSYYASEAADGAPAFVRKDVRVDFDWGKVTAPGGSPSPGYRDVGHDHFAVVWEGALVPAFSETYTLFVDAVSGARLSVRPSGGGAYAPVVDFLSGPAGTHSGTYAFQAGQSYDVKLEYRHGTGPARISLQWSSPSFPREVIDPLANVGLNNQSMNDAYADMVKGARSTWEGYDYSQGLDEHGWPRGDAEYIVQESLNQGLDISPLMRGKVSFQFTGKADGATTGWAHKGVEIFGNVDDASLTWSYDAATNTTRGSFTTVEGKHVNVVALRLFGTHRSPGGPAGFTDLRILRPTGVDATTSYAADGPIFTPQYKDAYSRFTAIRFQMVQEFERDWSERTLPGFFNQSSGQQASPKFASSFPGAPLVTRQSSTAYQGGTLLRVTAADGSPRVFYANNDGTTAAAQPKYTGKPGEQVTDGDILMLDAGSSNGPSWEYKVLLANETGRDLLLSLPVLASPDYVRKLALLLRYGSDGVNPYTAETRDPVYPPLNPNLRVYFEIGNELWNWGGVFWYDWRNVFNLVYTHAAANDADFQVLNYDGLPLTKNANGEYQNHVTWEKREWVLLTKQASDAFVAAFGAAGLHRRVRPIFEWQYDNSFWAEALQLLEEYYGNGDGKSHVADPRPPSAFLWGGGGATYYGAADPDGLTGAVAGFFETPAVSAGRSVAPTGGPWTFTGTAGIARPAAGGADPATGNVPGDDVPHQATTRGARGRKATYAVGDTVYLTAGDGRRHVYRCTTAGTSADQDAPPSAYAGASGEAVTDGGAVFQELTSQVGFIQGTGRMAYAFQVPAFTSPYFAVSFKAVNRTRADGTADAQTLRVFLDGVDVTARTFSGGSVYSPGRYGDGRVGPDWGATNVAWASSHYFSTRTFQARAAGESHTLELRGQSAGADVAYVSDVRLASVDAIFASGVPGGGGQAAGQPAAHYLSVLRVETLWPRIYGLQPAAYEGGWSIGGDDGGTMLQNQAKMGGGALTRKANKDALDMWRRLGGDFTAQGTYAQWPSYADYYAQEGLVSPGSWPLMQGVSDALDELPPAPSVPGEGLAPGTELSSANRVATYGPQYNGDLRAAGAWMAWMLVVPATRSYPVTLKGLRPTSSADAGHVTAAVVIDGETVLQASATGDATGSVTLTAGLHAVRVQNRNSGHLTFDRVVVGP